jgi:Mn-dependent DtxR family transcriptional regulator
VSSSFIKELKDLGYQNLTTDQLIRLKDHGVSASYIRKMQEKGYSNLPIDEYIRMRDRGEREQ